MLYTFHSFFIVKLKKKYYFNFLGKDNKFQIDRKKMVLTLCNGLNKGVCCGQKKNEGAR